MVMLYHSTKKLKCALVLVLAVLCVAGLTGRAGAAGITAHIDHNPVLLDETFILTLEADGAVDEKPDLSVLEKNFTIIETSTSTSVNIVNGDFSRKNAWHITLLPREVGVFTIPSVPFGRDRSPALRVTVKDTKTHAGKLKDKQLYLEVETDVKQTWVQAQIIYTVRIIRSINISNPGISPVKTSDPDAIIESLGEDKTYEALRDGVRYVITELKLAVYPQRSGELTFEPVEFQARVSDSPRRSIFDFDPFGQRGTIKRVRSRSLSVNVLPRPAAFGNSDWLPARELKLADSWSADTDQLKVGEPVTRTITLVATGLPGAQLPDITLPDIDGLKQYPDQPAVEDNKAAGGITGTRTVKLAFIATREGRYTLPEIAVPWWNTRTGQKQIARLPAVTLNARGAPATTATPPVMTQPQPAAPVTAPALPGASAVQPGLWPWISLALAIAWLLTLAALVLKQRGRTPPAPTTRPAAPDLRPLEKAVLRQARAHNARASKDALLAWARARWTDAGIASLADIRARCSPELGNAIEALNTRLYSRQQSDWNGTELARTFDVFRKRKPETTPPATSPLQPLYKT